MKWIKALMLVSVLAMMPTFALADDDRGDDIEDDFDTPAVPEPSGALVIGVALTTAALATRRKRG
jgi:hypothetical protein